MRVWAFLKYYQQLAWLLVDWLGNYLFPGPDSNQTQYYRSTSCSFAPKCQLHEKGGYVWYSHANYERIRDMMNRSFRSRLLPYGNFDTGIIFNESRILLSLFVILSYESMKFLRIGNSIVSVLSGWEDVCRLQLKCWVWSRRISGKSATKNVDKRLIQDISLDGLSYRLFLSLRPANEISDLSCASLSRASFKAF